MDKAVCESLLVNVKLTDGCCGFVVNLPILLESDVRAHDVHDVSLAVPAILLELTSLSIMNQNIWQIKEKQIKLKSKLVYPCQSLILAFQIQFLISWLDSFAPPVFSLWNIVKRYCCGLKDDRISSNGRY